MMAKSAISANGFLLHYGNGPEEFVAAAWKAPYFVFAPEGLDATDEPALIHCDDREHAERILAVTEGGQLYDALFERIERIRAMTITIELTVAEAKALWQAAGEVIDHPDAALAAFPNPSTRAAAGRAQDKLGSAWAKAELP